MADIQPQLNDRSRSSYLFSFFWRLLITLIVLFGLIIFIFYLILLPRPFKFYVTNAQLTQFDYTNNTLHYNMVLNFTAHNPNKRLSIYYDKVQAQAFSEGSRFANVDLITKYVNSFRQRKKMSDPISGVFSGQQLLMLNNDQVLEFNKEKIDGVHSIHMKLYFRIRFRHGISISHIYKPKVKCDIKVPLSSSNSKNIETFTFTQVLTNKCKVVLGPTY
ncbi:unnamed protein product [Lathyrus oleraceus]